MQAQERLFHRENDFNASTSISASASTRIKNFSFFLCLGLCLRSLALCENGAQHKHNARSYVRPMKTLVLDSAHIAELVNPLPLRLVLMLAFMFVFTRHARLCLCLCLRLCLGH